MGITLQGHVARILYSLSKAKAEDVCMRRERLRGMQRAVTATSSTENDSSPEKGTFNVETAGSTSSKSLEEDLLHGQASYSAHYLGSMEISNIDGTEESRRAMTELKASSVDIIHTPGYPKSNCFIFRSP
ncbi:hypothetical protein OESDEN_02550 [Oesophagostomum dentatum]|uniref:Uncharacterized protein n=1 Tax=Oesophagostomum dentatum TaxID=61180 RepID=A0A0B1TNQ0_OESDE|nr:hypothetical protein OESDEN_02550 [Oesophagostomum dentatum]